MFPMETSAVTNDNMVVSTVKLGRKTCLASRSIGKRSSVFLLKGLAAQRQYQDFLLLKRELFGQLSCFSRGNRTGVPFSFFQKLRFRSNLDSFQIFGI